MTLIMSPFVIKTKSLAKVMINLSQMTVFDYDKKNGTINVGWITDIPDTFVNVIDDGAITKDTIISAYKEAHDLIAVPGIEDYGCIVIRKDLVRSIMLKPCQGIAIRSTLIDPTTSAANITVGNSAAFTSVYNSTSDQADALLASIVALF